MYFLKFYYLFIWKTHREKFPCATSFSNAWDSEVWARPKLGAQNSIQVSNVGGGKSNIWPIPCCLPGCTSAGSWGVEWSWDWKSGSHSTSCCWTNHQVTEAKTASVFWNVFQCWHYFYYLIYWELASLNSVFASKETYYIRRPNWASWCQRNLSMCFTVYQRDSYKIPSLHSSSTRSEHNLACVVTLLFWIQGQHSTFVLVSTVLLLSSWGFIEILEF